MKMYLEESLQLIGLNELKNIRVNELELENIGIEFCEHFASIMPKPIEGFDYSNVNGNFQVIYNTQTDEVYFLVAFSEVTKDHYFWYHDDLRDKVDYKIIADYAGYLTDCEFDLCAKAHGMLRNRKYDRDVVCKLDLDVETISILMDLARKNGRTFDDEIAHAIQVMVDSINNGSVIVNPDGSLEHEKKEE